MIGCAASVVLLLTNESARVYLGACWRQQVLASVTGKRDGVDGIVQHLNILRYLAHDLLLPMLVAAVLVALARWRGRRRPILAAAGTDAVARAGWFSLLTALSASLPLVACPKQHGHYTAPSWPFYAFALALASLPSLWGLMPRLAWLATERAHGAVRWGALAFASCGVVAVACSYGGVYRDRDIIRQSDQIAAAFGRGAVVGVAAPSWRRLAGDEQLRLHAYCYRDHRISLWSTCRRRSRCRSICECICRTHA